MRSVITCVADCNLDPELPIQGLEKLIVSLEGMRRLKGNSHGQPPSSTKVNMQQQPRSISAQSQQPHTNSEAQRPRLTKGEMQPQPEPPPQGTKFEVQKQHPTNHQPRQQYPPAHYSHQQHPPAHHPHPPTHQPHQQHPFNNTAPQHTRRKKRKFNQFQNGSMKYPQKPPPRPVISSSSPVVGHDEKSQFPRYSSRYSGMHGLFGLHEAVGHESTEHGNHYTRPTRPIP